MKIFSIIRYKGKTMNLSPGKGTMRNTAKIKKISRWFKQLKRIVLLTIFVLKCKGCGCYLVFEDEDLVCKECLEEISSVRYYDRWRSKCQQCGRRMDHFYERCGQCILQPPPYRKHLSYSRYQDPLRELIVKYKYKGAEKLKYLFADYYTELFKEEVNESFEYIIPVPSDPGRQKKREFAPILEISKILSHRLQIPLLPDNLIKIKETEQQVKLTRAERLKNLDGAFKLRNPGQLKAKKVLLIDDVYTTGTTIHRCTRLLIEQGADVVVLTLAR